MDQLGNPLTTRQIKTAWEICIELYQNWWFGCIDNKDHQFGKGSGVTRTPTWSDSPEPLLPLIVGRYDNLHQHGI
jgi:hypothetical protein